MDDKVKILIIDDDKQYLQMLKEIIVSRFKKAYVKTFYNPDDFLIECKKKDSHLFIVDIKIKQKQKGLIVDGRDLCSQISRECFDTPFLFVSGYPITEEMFFPKVANCFYDFVGKAQNIEILLNRIKILLKLKSAMMPLSIKSNSIKEYRLLSGDKLRAYWQNVLDHDRRFVKSLMSQLHN